MGLNDVVSGERIHIGFFGLRNAGKSSVVNAVTGQNVALVSDVLGTTTDPVKKAMELLPLGPVLIIDTPGIDDDGELGEKRVEKTKEILSSTDVAVLVVDAIRGKTQSDNDLIKLFRRNLIPYVIAYNKSDLLNKGIPLNSNEIFVSAKTGYNIRELKIKIGEFTKIREEPKLMVGDLIEQGDIAVLVMPIDESAPKGRIILPQQMALREILNKKAVALTCQPSELKGTLNILSKRPKIVITDSQAFKEVGEIVPEAIPLTSFSVLMARYKGDLSVLVKGASALRNLKNGDKILISEGCTHHRQCNDIGSVKIPNLIRNFTGCELNFSFTAGGEFPDNISDYALVVHCGGCMLTKKEMARRLKKANSQNIPIVNYGVIIAYINGILKRSLEVFEK